MGACAGHKRREGAGSWYGGSVKRSSPGSQGRARGDEGIGKLLGAQTCIGATGCGDYLCGATPSLNSRISSREQPGELHDDPPAGAARVAGAVVEIAMGVLEAAEERAALGSALEDGLPLQEGEDGGGVGVVVGERGREQRSAALEGVDPDGRHVREVT